jgi:UDP-3-O-[3-hydroxymyristoyl] glucosamine N-acyltransferase
MKICDIAARLSCQLEGDSEVEITGVATLESAGKGELSFLANPKYHSQVKRSRASAVIADLELPYWGVPLLRSANPYLVFAKAIELFHSKDRRSAGVHPTAVIAATARLGRDVSVGPHSVIDEDAVVGDRVVIEATCVIERGSIVGDDSVLHSGCIVREGVRIGSRCVIQSNAVIGSDGFGYAKTDAGAWYKILQSGTVVIEDDVEIGACSTIDRAALGETRVGAGSKIDNLVQIGHACRIGSNTLLCAQAGLAGSSKVGNNVILAGQVGVAGHLTIGDGVIATAQSGIPASVEANRTISGSPAIEHRNWMKSSAAFARLPEVQKSIRMLEKRVKILEKSFKVSVEHLT